VTVQVVKGATAMSPGCTGGLPSAPVDSEKNILLVASSAITSCKDPGKLPRKTKCPVAFVVVVARGDPLARPCAPDCKRTIGTNSIGTSPAVNVRDPSKSKKRRPETSSKIAA
jgi:hypothetical protein